jgi:hypothetical protein
MFLSAAFDQPVCPLRNLARRVPMVAERPLRPALKEGMGGGCRTPRTASAQSGLGRWMQNARGEGNRYSQALTVKRVP